MVGLKLAPRPKHDHDIEWGIRECEAEIVLAKGRAVDVVLESM
jgi:hypothetical protein